MVLRDLRQRQFLDRKVEASLKHSNPSSAAARSEQFLDRKVEASLKHGLVDCDRLNTAAIPRPKGRGLIEAPP